jgi:hypothetical protein
MSKKTSTKPRSETNSKSTRTKPKAVVDAKKLAFVVDGERLTLGKIDALLGCLAFGLNYADYQEEFDTAAYCYVAEMARERLSAVIDNLEAFNLEKAAAAVPDVEIGKSA